MIIAMPLAFGVHGELFETRYIFYLVEHVGNIPTAERVICRLDHEDLGNYKLQEKKHSFFGYRVWNRIV